MTKEDIYNKYKWAKNKTKKSIAIADAMIRYYSANKIADDHNKALEKAINEAWDEGIKRRFGLGYNRLERKGIARKEAKIIFKELDKGLDKIEWHADDGKIYQLLQRLKAKYLNTKGK